MGHQFPIPEGNSSPYPRTFPPTAEAPDEGAHDERDDAAAGAAKIDAEREKRWPVLSGKTLGAAAGIGSAALLAALLYAGKRNGGRPH